MQLFGVLLTELGKCWGKSESSARIVSADFVHLGGRWLLLFLMATAPAPPMITPHVVVSIKPYLFGNTSCGFTVKSDRYYEYKVFIESFCRGGFL